MIFRSNQGFVFHDSRGFEAGGTSELDDVKKFIKLQAKEKELPDQIHAIWLVMQPFAIRLQYFSCLCQVLHSYG